MMNLAVPLFALSLNASSTEIGMIRGMMGIGDFLVVLIAGILVDYFGTRAMYITACISSALCILAISQSFSPLMLLILMVFYGIVRSFRTTALNADFFKHMHTIGITYSGWYRGSTTFGIAFIGPTLGGIVIAYLAYTEYFIFTSMFLLIPLLTMYFLHTNGSDTNDLMVMSKPGSIIDSIKYYPVILKNRIFLLVSSAECCSGSFYNVFITFITVLVVHVLGQPPGIAALLISLRGLSQVFVMVFCGNLLYKNHNQLIIISFLMLIVSVILLGVTQEIFILGIATTINGAFSGLISLIKFTDIGSINGEKGKIAGLSTFTGCFGSILGPLFGGIIADIYGIQNMFLAFIPLFLLITIIFLKEEWQVQKEKSC